MCGLRICARPWRRYRRCRLLHRHRHRPLRTQGDRDAGTGNQQPCRNRQRGPSAQTRRHHPCRFAVAAAANAERTRRRRRESLLQLGITRQPQHVHRDADAGDQQQHGRATTKKSEQARRRQQLLAFGRMTQAVQHPANQTPHDQGDGHGQQRAGLVGFQCRVPSAANWGIGSSR